MTAETSSTPEVAVVPAAEPSPMLSGRNVLILATFISITSACLAIFAYDRWVAPKPRQIAVLSLQSVLDAKQAQFADVVSRSGATDDDRVRALQGVDEFMVRLEKEVAAIQADCPNCVVLVRDAVVGRGDVDLTPVLMSRLGMADLNLVEVQERIRRNVRSAAPDRGTPVAKPKAEGAR